MIISTFNNEFNDILEISRKSDFIESYNNAPIIIYGAGQMGKDALTCLLEANVKVDCFLDKNPNIIGQSINNIPVIHPETLTSQQKENYIFAVSLVKFPFNSIRDYLLELGCKNICFIGDIVNQNCDINTIMSTWRLNNLSEDHYNQLKYLFKTYNDEISKKALLQFLYWVISGEEKHFLDSPSDMNEKYFIPEVIDVLTDNEVFVDYDYININSISEIENLVKDKFSAIHSFDPDEENIKIREEKLSLSKNKDKITLYKFGLANNNSEYNFEKNGSGLTVTTKFTSKKEGNLLPVIKLDSVMENKPYTYLKIYGLGIAQEVVKGAMESIKKYRPIIAITVHHQKEDFIEIPYLLMNNLRDYKFYLRLHSYCGFETIFYAIPNERGKL
jgi:FkbM family methyltransferase